MYLVWSDGAAVLPTDGAAVLPTAAVLPAPHLKSHSRITFVPLVIHLTKF